MEEERFLHKSIMLDEVISILNPSENEIYVDCTLGAGGHTRQILKTAKCNVVGIDRDPSAFSLNREEYKAYGKRLSLVEGKFGDLENHISNHGIEKVDAVFLDLGVSSMQLDNAERGFSFRFDAPLDMRMGSDGQTAFEIQQYQSLFAGLLLINLVLNLLQDCCHFQSLDSGLEK